MWMLYPEDEVAQTIDDQVIGDCSGYLRYTMAEKSVFQFMLGDEILVAPVLKKGKKGISERKVYLPGDLIICCLLLL